MSGHVRPTSFASPTSTSTPARVSDNATTYQDATGENPAAPDITTVIAVNNNAGLIGFRVNVPNRPTLTADMLISIEIDTDNNTATGSQPEGAEYAIEVFEGAVGLYKWDGTGFTRRSGDPPATTLVYAYANGAATIGINAAELANTRAFKFQVFVIAGITKDTAGNLVFTNATADLAPALNTPLYPYTVIIGTDPGPGTGGNRVRITSFTAVPRVPLAGEAFEVTVTVKRVGRAGVYNGTVYCQARVGSTKLRLYASPRRGGASCLWNVPVSATGKVLSGSIGVSEGGPIVTRRFSARVRDVGAHVTTEGPLQTLPSDGPVSGQKFQLSQGIGVERGGEHHRIQTGTVVCNAAIGSSLRLIASKREVVRDSGVRCTWNRIPSGTSGQRLSVAVTVRSQGGSVTFRYSKPIR